MGKENIRRQEAWAIGNLLCPLPTCFLHCSRKSECDPIIYKQGEYLARAGRFHLSLYEELAFCFVGQMKNKILQVDPKQRNKTIFVAFSVVFQKQS